MKYLLLELFAVSILVLTLSCSKSTGPEIHYGSIIISSEPIGATITLDGRCTNQPTPDTLRNILTGVHQIILTLDGYPACTTATTVVADSTTIVDIDLNITCPGGIIGNLDEEAVVSIEKVHFTVKGKVINVNAQETRVILYSKYDGQWSIEPNMDQCQTVICSDGSWSNWSQRCDRIVAVIVDYSFVPKQKQFEHPSSLPGVIAWCEYPDTSGTRKVQFSGYSWCVKNNDGLGPDLNHYSDGTSFVWVDGDGLKLRMAWLPDLETWCGSEVFLDSSLGYGVYTVQFAGRMDIFDPKTIFAAFLHETRYRKIVAEFTSAAHPYNAWFVIQPDYSPVYKSSFQMPEVTQSTIQFIWVAESITFRCWEGYAEVPDTNDIIHSYQYFDNVSALRHLFKMRFKFYRIDDTESGHNDMVTIKSFSYQPA